MPDSIKQITADLARLFPRQEGKTAMLKLLKRAHALGKQQGSSDAEVDDKVLAVVEAATEWVTAEAFFRLGPNAYDDTRTRMYIEAEEALRDALTGHADLRAAGEAVGCVLTPLYNPRERRKPKKRRR